MKTESPPELIPQWAMIFICLMIGIAQVYAITAQIKISEENKVIGVELDKFYSRYECKFRSAR